MYVYLFSLVHVCVLCIVLHKVLSTHTDCEREAFSDECPRNWSRGDSWLVLARKTIVPPPRPLCCLSPSQSKTNTTAGMQPPSLHPSAARDGRIATLLDAAVANTECSVVLSIV